MGPLKKFFILMPTGYLLLLLSTDVKNNVHVIEKSIFFKYINHLEQRCFESPNNYCKSHLTVSKSNDQNLLRIGIPKLQDLFTRGRCLCCRRLTFTRGRFIHRMTIILIRLSYYAK